MPQAEPELRALMRHYFGDATDTKGPMDFLHERGYRLTKTYGWELLADHPVSIKEELCLRFLRDEWDFGWVEIREGDDNQEQGQTGKAAHPDHGDG